MKRFACLLLVALCIPVLSAEKSIYWKSSPVPVRTGIDRALAANWEKNGIPVPGEASDCVMVRRLYLDLAGRLPTPEEAQAYLREKDPKKQEKLVNALLQSDDFADYWTMHWCDALRVKSEFPINLWPNAVYGYQRRIRRFLKENEPYCAFVRSLLTGRGSNFRVPEANFYRAVANRTPEGIAGAAALSFLGSRLEKWPEKERKGFIAFFEPVRYKSTREWKEEIVYWNVPEAELKAAFAVTAHPGFAPALVNRVWAWLFGSGIVEPADDMFPGNPPSNPELLAELTGRFTASGYDLRELIRSICLSAAYRAAGTGNPAAEKSFASYPVRRLDAELIDDAIRDITGTGSKFQSVIPEPFTFLPGKMRAINIADGSISSSFLILFGRPSRDTGTFAERNNAITGKQRLQLFNSGDIYSRLGGIFQNNKGKFKGMGKGRGKGAGKGNAKGKGMGMRPRVPVKDQPETLYWLFFSRPPTPEERSVIHEELNKIPRGRRSRFSRDLSWILMNTKEFLYRH